MTAANTTVADPEHVELLLSRLDELPPLAPVATHVLALTQDDKGSIRRLTELVSSDPSLTRAYSRFALRPPLPPDRSRSTSTMQSPCWVSRRFAI